MRENYSHLFANWRTGIYVENGIRSQKNLLSSLAAGNCFMTNGPAIRLQAFSDKKWYSMGSKSRFASKVLLEALSSTEYGSIKEIRLFIGDVNAKKEFTFFEEFKAGPVYSFEKQIELKSLPKSGYVRAEVITDENFQALSNPIWF
jgi:hypothetical protein